MAEENSKDQTLGDTNPAMGASLNAGAMGGDIEVEDKYDFKMLTEEIKEEIEECFDIFDKDKDG